MYIGGFTFFMLKTSPKYVNLFLISMFDDPHYDFMFTEVKYRIYQKSFLFCYLQFY